MTESENLAATYAASVAQGIRANAETGNAFGVVDADNYADDKAEGEALDAFDYLATVLDIEYVTGGAGEFRGALVLVTVGGPHAWIDTRTGDLEVRWGSHRATEKLPETFTNALHDACAEYLGAR